MSTLRSSAFTAAAVLAAALLVQACSDDDGPSGPPDTYTLAVTLTGIGQGTVTSEPAGIDCTGDGAECSATFEEGTQVTLTAAPAAGFDFAGWTGDGSGETTRTVAMSADRAVTAAFDDPDLAVETIGADGGTVASRDGGVTLDIPAGALTGEQQITIERIDPADLGDEWNDVDATGIGIDAAYKLGPDGLTFETPIVVTFDADVTAADDEGAVRLGVPFLLVSDGETVESLGNVAVAMADEGNATVRGELGHFSYVTRTSNGVEMSVHGIPPELVVEGTADLDLEVEVEPDHAAASGVALAGDPVYTDQSTGPFGPAFTSVVFESDEPSVYQLATATYRCAEPGTSLYRSEISVAVRLKLASGEAIDAETFATFTQTVTCVQGHTLTVTTSGEGSGMVTSLSPVGGGGIVCGARGTECEAEIPAGSTVTLYAAPDEGSTFEGWSGDGTDDQQQEGTARVVIMNGDRTVDAEFGLVPSENAEVSVSLTGPGNATVTSDPAGIECVKAGDEVSGTCAAEFPIGSEVRLTGTTEDGSRLTDWSGGGTINDEGDLVAVVAEAGPNSFQLNIGEVPASVFMLDLLGFDAELIEAIRIMFGGWLPATSEAFGPAAFGPASFAPAATAPAVTAAASGPACPDILVAGKGGAKAVDGCSGDLIRSFDFDDWTFYDAFFLPRPEGAAGEHSVLLTGQNYAIFFLDDAGEITSQVGNMFFGTVSDATLIGGDPSAGVVVVGNLGGPRNVNFFRFDPDLGYFDLHDSLIGATHLPGAAQSAVAGPTPPLSGEAPEEVLVIGVSQGAGVLYHIDMPNDPDEEFPEHTNVGTLGGDNPRRIRCDFDSGVCAVSDFDNSLITVVLWDGTGMPTIAGVTALGAVADGPVGIDIFGHRIVAAGYNDDQYSIIEVDAAGSIVDVTTNALPEGCTRPGHAIFLRDGANTIMVSCHGSTAVARVPHAF